MFRVENADFIADKLASELLPYQEYREAFKNGEEAVTRRMITGGVTTGGRVEFDVDWGLRRASGEWYLACADNGDGMTRAELERYMTTLAVRGANDNQSLTGNQGMGLKISGPTRHRRGLIIRSLKNGERWMVQIGWNGEEYGLIPLGPDGEFIMPVPEEMFPEFIKDQGSGTVVTFLGNADGDNTVLPADGRPKGWLFKYMHLRFFRLTQGDIDVIVRVPAGDPVEWPDSAEEAAEREAGRARPSFNRSKVYGTASIWDEAADRLGKEEFRGVAELPGRPDQDIPAARLHWWVLPGGPGSDVSSRTASGGSISVLFQNELHDWRVAGAANPFFGRLGVLFGKTRIAFVLEPQGTTIASDFARAHVLVGGKPVFETDAWLVWSDQFRTNIPDVIKRTMAEEQARIEAEDPDRARRIKERLKDVMRLLRPRRLRPVDAGTSKATGPSVSGADDSTGAHAGTSSGGGKRRKSGGTRGIGALLTQVDSAGDPAEEVFSILKIDPRWVSEAEADDFPIVNGNGRGLRDRAAALAGEDATTAEVLLLNRDFRGFQTILRAINDWANAEGDEDKAAMIEGFTREWVEQKMIEAVLGLRQLENGSTWTATSFDDALSPVALTAAFMADRYHTLREVKRQAGAVRAGRSASGGR